MTPREEMEAECTIETLYRTSGGQHAGSTPTSVTVRHLSGISATVDCCRSQHANRKAAFDMVELGLAVTEGQRR